MVKKISNSSNRREKNAEDNAKPISRDLNKNLEQIKSIFANCSDIVYREFLIGYKTPVKAALIYVDGLIDKVAVHDHLLKSLTLEARGSEPDEELLSDDLYQWIDGATITVAEKKQVENLDFMVLWDQMNFK